MRYVKQRQCTSKMSIFDAVSYPNLCSLCRPIWTQKPSCRSFPSRRCSATTTGTTSAELASSTRDMFSPRHTVSNSDNHRCQIACVTDLSSYCSPKKNVTQVACFCPRARWESRNLGKVFSGLYTGLCKKFPAYFNFPSMTLPTDLSSQSAQMELS